MGIVERKEREKEARRTAILDAAEMIFRDRGFAAATMDDIAKRAELAKGTVYLYYRSKEDLQLGLVHRGMEMLCDAFAAGMDERSSVGGKSSAIERLLTLGESYWRFAEAHYFYFELLHFADLPHRHGQATESSIATLNERSNAIWELLIGEIERAKEEGTIQPSVNSMAVGSMLWLNSTSVLRFHFKMKAIAEAGAAVDNQSEFSMCRMDWRQIYSLNANLLFHEIVTARGAMYLQPIEWPSQITLDVPKTERVRNGHQFMSLVRELPFEHFHETGV